MYIYIYIYHNRTSTVLDLIANASSSSHFGRSWRFMNIATGEVSYLCIGIQHKIVLHMCNESSGLSTINKHQTERLFTSGMRYLRLLGACVLRNEFVVLQWVRGPLTWVSFIRSSKIPHTTILKTIFKRNLWNPINYNSCNSRNLITNNYNMSFVTECNNGWKTMMASWIALSWVTKRYSIQTVKIIDNCQVCSIQNPYKFVEYERDSPQSNVFCAMSSEELYRLFFGEKKKTDKCRPNFMWYNWCFHKYKQILATSCSTRKGPHSIIIMTFVIYFKEITPTLDPTIWK